MQFALMHSYILSAFFPRFEDRRSSSSISNYNSIVAREQRDTLHAATSLLRRLRRPTNVAVYRTVDARARSASAKNTELLTCVLKEGHVQWSRGGSAGVTDAFEPFSRKLKCTIDNCQLVDF
jgi:hypothetical protein